MKGLLLKDFYVIKDTLFIQLIILSAIGVSMSFAITPLVFIVISTGTFSLFSGTAIVSDKTSGWDMFSNTIPISKAKVIRSKYLLSILLILVGLFLGVILSLLLSLIMGGFESDKLFMFILVALSISLASASTGIPLSILFDDKKQVLAMLFSILMPTVLMVAVLFVSSMFMDLQQNIMMLAYLMFGVGVIMFVLSLLVAPTILSKKDI
ncbi:MAG: ABC-2 transporter permease [Spirochaetales bacterium]